MNTFGTVSTPTLSILGPQGARSVWWNLSTAEMYEQAIARGEARVAHGGPLVVRTGQHTGRSPKDKYIVASAETEPNVWWGQYNGRYPASAFDALLHRMQAYAQDKDLFVQDVYAGTDATYRLPVRVVTETAWHSLFAHTMFVRPTVLERRDFDPDFTVFQLPYFHADPERDNTNSDVFVIINFERRLVLIGGTQYAGEIKKSIFTVMNYLLPRRGVLSMHASANIGPDLDGNGGDVAVFFGLSGTGKTTLSADSSRRLIGDDEHGWSQDGVFNLEGGCYAKVIHLSASAEPEIFSTTKRFGTVLENVAMLPDRHLNLDDDTLTENTRAAYPRDSLTLKPDFSLTGLLQRENFLLRGIEDLFDAEPFDYPCLSGVRKRNFMVAVITAGDTDNSEIFLACASQDGERGTESLRNCKMHIDKDGFRLQLSVIRKFCPWVIPDRINLAPLRWFQFPERREKVRLPGLIGPDEGGHVIAVDPAAVFHGPEIRDSVFDHPHESSIGPRRRRQWQIIQDSVGDIRICVSAPA